MFHDTDLLKDPIYQLGKFDWNDRNPEALGAAIKAAQDAGHQVVRLGKDGDGAFITKRTVRKDGPSLNRIRINEIGGLIQHRHGGPCDTDDGEIYLEAVLPHLQGEEVPVREWVKVATPKLLTDPAFAWVHEKNPKEQWDEYFKHIERAARMGPKAGPITMNQPDVDPEAGDRLRFLSADKIARLLCVTPEERRLLGFRTIGAVGLSKTRRAKDRKEQNAAYQKAKRRAQGANPREQSLSVLRPWETEGISRRTWERRRANANRAAQSDS